MTDLDGQCSTGVFCSHTSVGDGVGAALRNMHQLTAVLLPYTRVTAVLATDLATLQHLRVLKVSLAQS
jgi:hypothetical protein